MKTTQAVWAALILTAMGGCKQDPPVDDSVRPVRAIKVGDYASIAGRSLPGRASAAEEVNLSFRVGGPLIELPVRVGDQVKRGDVIAQIDPTDFRVAVDDATANLERAERELDAMRVARPEEIRVAEENVNAVTASLARANSDHDRNIRLLDGNAISQREFDRTRALLDVAKAELKSAEEQLGARQTGARPEDIAAQQAEIRSLKASLENAKNQLAYTSLKAPFDGNISATFVDNFQTVQAKQLIVRLVDISAIEMTIFVPESGISLVPHVKQITCTFDAFPDKAFSAEIKEVGKEASRTTRTFPITLRVEQQHEGITILPGMAGRAVGEMELPDDGVAGYEIPETAIFSDSGTQYVWIIDGSSKTVSRQQVTPGEITPFGIRVPDLQPGQWIATAGVHYLAEGQQVRIMGNVPTDDSVPTGVSE